MVNPLGPRIAKYTAAKAGHDVVLTAMQRLKVAAHFVHGGERKMKAVYDKAQAQKDAREAVILARQSLERDKGICAESSLDYLGELLTEVLTRAPDDQRRKKSEYRVALFEAAWKQSIGKKKGLILLNTREGKQRDGTKALRSDLQRAFDSHGLEEFRTAKALVRLLDQVKQCESPSGCSGRIPLSKPLIDLLFDNASALSSACELLSASPHIGLPLGIALLNGIDPTKTEDLQSLNPFTGGRAGGIDPNLPRMEALTKLSKALADHYLEKLSLSDAQKENIRTAIESAEDDEEVKGLLLGVHRLSLIAYDKSNGSVAGDVGIVLTEYLHRDDERWQFQRARDLARPVVDEVLAELPARFARMNITLESEDAYTALLAAARNKIRTVQPSWISDKLMDEAVQEECWKAIVGTQEKAPAQPGQQEAATKQDRLGDVSSRQMQAALTSVRNLPGELISGPQLLRLVEDHFEVFSGPVWLHKEARVSLPEYLGLANAIHVLEMLIDKDEYTKEDTELLLSTLKEQNVPDPRMRGFSFSGSPETPSTFDLRKPDETRSRMIEAVHDRYFSGAANLYGDKRKQFDAEFQAASSADAKIKALKVGMTLLLEQTKLEKDRVVAMLDDLALLRPVRVRESLV
jgi:hypothetical protein